MDSQDQHRLPPPGQMAEIGGFRLHAVVRGQGSPTVVFESGLGGCALQFGPVLAGVSAFTGAVAYDRAGQAWSDASPRARTPSNISGELMELLRRLDLQPPYIWVGHSLGGLLALIYAGLHPQATAGVVLVDSSDVEQYDTFPSMDKVVNQMAAGMRLLKLLARVGLASRLTKLSLGRDLKWLPRAESNAFLGITSRPRHYDTTLAEFSQHRHYFGAQSDVPRSLGDLPLSVVTAGSSVSGRQKFGGMTADELNAKHQGWQKERARLSSQGEQVVIPGATHLSILLQPENAAQVVGVIRRMVEGVRESQALSSAAAL